MTQATNNVVTIKALTKADRARDVFADAYAQPVVPARKEILELAQVVADLSKAAASTYLQNFKRSQGMVRASA